MMKNAQIVFAAVMGIVLVTSCERIVPVDPPDHSPLLVLDGLIQANKPWEVYISQTQSYFENLTPSEIEDAHVWIELMNGDTFDLPYTSALSPTVSPPFLAGYQRREFLPEAEQTYTIYAQAPGFEVIEASMTMPPNPIVLNTEWEDSAFVDPDGKLVSRLSITLKDPNTQKRNFFFVYTETIEGPTTNIEWKSDDPAIRFSMRLAQRDNRNIYSVFQQAEYISDDWFSDSIQTIDFFIPSSRMDFLSNYYDGWSLKIACINEPFYLYAEDYVKQTGAAGNPFAEPSPVYTNVLNGAGIWGGFSLDSVSFYW